eukprot:CAMPEP_0172439360 /NCGR_PEP_ID=MMETSP1065-20121228/374_1 /TAXON_ID=265537 /ORGANISM="Amphiprora paludosa, Strain CCMP125" /LENGTH=424 /DNA_ID=CAMNT_0013188035 /DNA_START=91 /DNA_END=1362 /DNA_ORIENTATION=+
MPPDILQPYANDPMVRILACGGDGTMGWMESSLDTVWERLAAAESQSLDEEDDTSPEQRQAKFNQMAQTHFPLAMIPLGTGNDLSRTFHWGKQYAPVTSKLLQGLQTATPRRLDRWRCVVIPDDVVHEQHRHWIPDMLGTKQISTQSRSESIYNPNMSPTSAVSLLSSPHSTTLSPANNTNNANPSPSNKQRSSVSLLPPEQEVLDGIFCNYLSIGFDAQVAFQFHKDRREHPERYKSVLGNKLKYAIKGITNGTQAPKLTGKMTVLVSPQDTAAGASTTTQWKELPIPSNCRSIVLLNIPSYGGGSQLANEGRCDDGLIDVIFMTTVWRLAIISGTSTWLPMVRYDLAAQTSRICLKTHEALHCQVDGEPWLQGAATLNIRHYGERTVLDRGSSTPPWNCCAASSATTDATTTAPPTTAATSE